MDKPRAKLLEWSNETKSYHKGYGLVGIYRITNYAGMENPFKLDMPEYLEGGSHPTLEAAKDAAQSDYEARILAALEPMTVQEAARVLMQNKAARDTAFNAFWDVSQKHSLEATNRAGARYSITGNVVNEMWYAALIALADTGEDG